MQVGYGSYKHRKFECSWTFKVEPVRNAAQQAWGLQETWQINGLMTSQASTEAARRNDIRARFSTLETAYLYDGLDATIYYPNGTIHRRMSSAKSIGGVRVIQHPSCPRGSGVELVNLRTYAITLQAIFPINGSSALESFDESVQILPYGRKRTVIETLVGPPVEQIVRQQQKWRAVQSGTAVGKYARPPIPPPIWPSALINQFNPPQDGHPRRRIGNTLLDWPVSWRYEFESITPLTGTSNVWGMSYNL